MKTILKAGLIALMAAMVPVTGYADTVTKTVTTISIRTDAPIYTGVVEDVKLLEPLTLEEFQNFGTKPAAAFQQYQEYKQKIENPTPDTGALPFKMKVYRPLTLADFQEAGIPVEVAQARYDTYLRAVPIRENDKDVRYVYVYHTPVYRAV